MKTVVLKIESLMQSKFILWLVVVAGTILHGILCFGQTIWLDEALTGSYIRMGWWDLICFTTTDVHPPLYYLIVKLGITLFGDHIYVIKLFSFLPFVFGLLFIAKKITNIYGSKAAFMLAVLFCTTPCIIERNSEMRMYQWAMFFVFTFAVCLFEAVKVNVTSVKKWLLCAVLGLLAAYTHYYALVAVALLYAIQFFLNLKNRRVVKSILINAGISIAGYLPWLIVFLKQAKTLKETGWWQKAGVSLEEIYDFVVWPFVDNTGYETILFLILLLFVLAGYIRNKSEHRMVALCGMGTYFLIIFLGVMIILFYQPVFIARFLYPAVGLLLLGLALGISGWRTEVICFISILLLFFAAKTYNSQLHYQYNEESVPRLTLFMESIGEDGSLIVCDQDAVKCIVEYLYPDYRIRMEQDVEAEDIEDREVYYFVCDPKNYDKSTLESLGLREYEYVDDIYFLYHGFEIYSVW